ncbi:MAG: hypothetical protein AUK34_04030 [Ignavibacteria bacterium CG2_30_36_16]|nr:hypothetical protein [Ignavibacteria bacterium]OIP62022.1 MAG: hypothetical protein AUK34_04030 [Ignavibacteria bacterium CG2_30_36_16]PIQ07604.1 MAG: hypothetical protein COW71_16180 [Ignavibacteriales bacterium CG18_big_fil_WC_8_21_14_2_50_31_20]PJB02162.1 MAG: hypothetical protein CO127_00610 [Ignavibacteria bacterium CG_4_9_14_3_um_filter_36_18]
MHDPYYKLLKTVAEINGCQLDLIIDQNHSTTGEICRACNSNNSKNIQYFLAGLKLQVKELRSLLKGAFANIDYSDRFTRTAYMLAYFPFYIEPIYYVTKSHINKLIEANTSEINICFIGGGPLPELLGLSKSISAKNNVSILNCSILDAFPYWITEREYCTKSLLEDYFKGEVGIDSLTFNLWSNNLKIPKEIHNADLVVAQNCINDCPKDKFSIMKNNFQIIWNNMKKNSSIIILDLNYNTISDLLKNLKKYFSQSGGEIVQDISRGEKRPSIPKCQHLEELLFEQTDGLLARRVVKYYSLIVKKI